MDIRNKFMWTFLLISLLSFRSIDGDGLRLPDQPPAQQQQQQQQSLNVQHIQQQQQPQQNGAQPPPVFGEERGRQGKGLLDLFGLGVGGNVDPYVARTNGKCLSGDLAECFKTQALSTFDEILVRNDYGLTDFARVVRVSDNQARSLYQEPYEFSSETRANDDEWEQLKNFALRRLERFIKSTALEVNMPEEITEGGRYSPRFLNDIDGEIETIEDKHAPLLKRKQFKKLIIPLLLVLKIFKLKLLLFLPFILGLIGLKKLLGIAAIVLPGALAFFKLCRSQANFGGPAGGFGGGIAGLFGAKNTFPEYSPQGVGAASYHQHQHVESYGGNPFYRQEPTFSKPYTDYYSKNSAQDNNNGFRFGESHPQDLAYQNYPEYRSANKEVS